MGWSHRIWSDRVWLLRHSRETHGGFPPALPQLTRPGGSQGHASPMEGPVRPGPEASRQQPRSAPAAPVIPPTAPRQRARAHDPAAGCPTREETLGCQVSLLRVTTLWGHLSPRSRWHGVSLTDKARRAAWQQRPPTPTPRGPLFLPQRRPAPCSAHRPICAASARQALSHLCVSAALGTAGGTADRGGVRRPSSPGHGTDGPHTPS